MSALDLHQPVAETTPTSSSRAVSATLLLLGLLGLLTFAATVGQRMGFAFPLEWMEGASLDHALRLLGGQPLYAAPSAEFIAYIYPPLAYVPMALAVALLGPSLAAARAASLACTALALLAIGRAVARGSGSLAAGCAAAGLFAIGFGYAGAFLDLARVDACFVLLIALAAERLVAQRPNAALAWLALSVFAKQHGLLLLAAVSVALLLQGRRRAVAVAWLAVGAAFAALELVSSGFFARYTAAVPSGHGFHPALVFAFLTIDLLLYVPFLVVSCTRGLWLRLRARTLEPFDALVLAAVIAGALGRAHVGGHDNVRLPAFVVLCIAGCIELGRALAVAPVPGRRSGRVWLLVALALQFVMLFQWPSYHAPVPASAEGFQVLRASLLRAGQGAPAVALDHARLTATPFMHTMALSDLRSGGDAALARAGTEALLARLRGPDAPAAVAVGERFDALERALEAKYRLCLELRSPPLTTGYQPGTPLAGALMQQIYVRADLYDPARCEGPKASATKRR